MIQSQCLITGCDFLDAENLRYIHGDLHQLFNVLIFNASGCKWMAVSEKEPMNPEHRMVRALGFYEKNNVIVFPLEFAQFNEVAHKFLASMIKLEEKQIITFGDTRKH